MKKNKLNRARKVFLVYLIITIYFCIIIFTDCVVAFIKVEPKDYDIEFSAWGYFGHSIYTPAQRDSMNNNSVHIFASGINIEDSTNQQIFIDSMLFWKENYSDITFSAVINPSWGHGAFVWEGNIDNVIENSKKMIKIIINNSLTNVKGIVFDFEAPYFNEESISFTIPNEERHQEVVSKWNDFFEWKDSFAPNLLVDNVNYISSSLDVLIDNDHDLNNLFGFITYEVSHWDHYIPMLYRSFPVGPKPYGDSGIFNINEKGNDFSYEVFIKMDIHSKTIKNQYNNIDKAGILLGISNVSSYGKDSIVYEFGELLGSGFDVLARDVIIAKHFNIQEVTFLTLHTYTELGYEFAGVFSAYGDDFFDKMDQKVNSPESLLGFSIPVGKLGSAIIDADIGLPFVVDIIWSVRDVWILLVILIIAVIILIKELIWHYIIKEDKKKTGPGRISYYLIGNNFG